MARSPQCRCGALIEEPTDGHVNDPLAVTIPGELIEMPDRGQILGKARQPEFRVGQTKIVAVEMRIFLQLAGQKTAAQRAIGQGRETACRQ